MIASAKVPGIGALYAFLVTVFLVLIYIGLCVAVTRVRRRRQARWLDAT